MLPGRLGTSRARLTQQTAGGQMFLYLFVSLCSDCLCLWAFRCSMSVTELLNAKVRTDTDDSLQTLSKHTHVQTHCFPLYTSGKISILSSFQFPRLLKASSTKLLMKMFGFVWSVRVVGLTGYFSVHGCCPSLLVEQFCVWEMLFKDFPFLFHYIIFGCVCNWWHSSSCLGWRTKM